MAKRSVYDAIVVGSGAAGGWAAKELTERGLNTILLEAGRTLDPIADFPGSPPASAPGVGLLNRAQATVGGQAIQARCMSFSPLTRHLFVNDRQNPYRTAAGKRFNWYRGRQVGGRLHLWGRNALRISDLDFKAASYDGFGSNWPLSYADLAPWYDKVEAFLGVHGSPAGLANLPDGLYDHAHTLTDAEATLLQTLSAAWPDRPVTTSRIVRHNPGRTPLPIVAATRTGRLDLRSDTIVSHIAVDAHSGAATGVVFLDRESKQTHEVRGRVVVLCASTIESIRIMLNSTSSVHPRGLGNSSGTLGHFLTDHVVVFRAGPYSPLAHHLKADPYDFGAQTGIYMPSFRNVDGARDANFLRGYSILGSIGRIEPGWFFFATGEMLPRFDNAVELDSSVRDAWGIPAAKITCVHSDNEREMVADMKASLAELARIAGLDTTEPGSEHFVNRLAHRVAAPLLYTPEGALLPGSAVHEAGGACMGDDAASSVLNKFNQCWDAKNVFVTDAAAFTTSPFQNPGLTIMALSARAANHIADELAGGRL